MNERPSTINADGVCGRRGCHDSRSSTRQLANNPRLHVIRRVVFMDDAVRRIEVVVRFWRRARGPVLGSQ